MATKKKRAPPAPPPAKKVLSPISTPPPEDAPPSSSVHGIPIVGIGASAGGLDAFKKLFTAMPADGGVAFVLVPHLDPKHESLMVELLARHTKMPVSEAADGVSVESNHVYIIPPNKYMTILGGALHLTGPVERGTGQTSIDLFLRSLADDQMEHAICIILSGTGGHGTLGLKAVIQIRRNGSYHRITVTVKPLMTPKSAEGLLMIVFQDVLEREAGPTGADPAVESQLVRQLEYELRATKEDLQSTVEEMESANEELKASNEEVMSMNEELQSANEELETSKEELQSLNEELSTVNSQLQDKVEALEQANNDISNLLNCTDIATVFLDSRLRIRRFTPAAQRLLSVVSTDVGRPITDIKLKFEDADIVQDVEAVMQSLAPREKEVRADEGRWCIRRIIPYRTFDNRIEGAVITFNDVTQLKLAGLKSGLLATVLRNSRDAVIVHDFDGKITSWNHGAEQLYGYAEAEAQAMNVRQILPEKLRAEYTAIVERLKRDERVNSWETQQIAKNGELIDAWVTATALTDEHGKPIVVAKIDRDITEQKRAKDTLEAEVKRRTADLHENQDRLQAILNTPDDAIITINQNGIIESANAATERLFGYTAAAMIGKNINVLVPTLASDEHRSDLRNFQESGVARVGALGRELQARRKDGSSFWVDLSVSQVKGRSLYTGIIRDISRRKELEREVIEISTLEQQRIGQDLHDECGQEITALGLFAGTLAETLTDANQVETVRKLRAGLGKVLRQLRNLAQGLAVIEVQARMLPAALGELAQRIADTSGMRCEFKADQAVHVGENTVATHLYHIAQEACTNAVKHAKPRNIDIAFRAEDNSVILEVRDDGVGIAKEITNGLGLRIMRNRASVIGATLAIETAKPQGTVVTCVLTKEIRHDRS